MGALIPAAPRLVWALALLSLVSACGTQRAPDLDPELWRDYQQRFVRDGRVIDSGNGDVSHSEGQGYGMLFAVAANDRAGFDALWRWTARVLQRDDGLFAWRYAACPAADARCVTDSNNASDGELLIAWALLRAHAAWDDTSHRVAADRILEAVARQLVVTQGRQTLLLPGREGFRHGDALTLNLSYWVFPALQAFREHQPGGPWQALLESGQSLVEAARFGAADLPPDWLALENGELRPSPRFPTRYGFDACRIPLYMAWADLVPDDGWRAFTRFWQRDPVPAWIDLRDDSAAGFAWNRGMASIAALVTGTPPGLPAPTADDDYYSTSLILLSRLAAAGRDA